MSEQAVGISEEQTVAADSLDALRQELRDRLSALAIQTPAPSPEQIDEILQLAQTLYAEQAEPANEDEDQRAERFHQALQQVKSELGIPDRHGSRIWLFLKDLFGTV